MNKYLTVTLVLVLLIAHSPHAGASFSGSTRQFTATDGVPVTADLYLVGNTDAAMILLFHQAGYSRGEYREIAPELNALGFNAMAIDQRSGKTVNGIKNRTNEAARALGKSTEYADAIADLEAAFSYARDELKAKRIIIWGSSYSAALVFYLAVQHQDDIGGLLAFSPGEYFKIDGQTIETFAARVKCPVFVTSARAEQVNWKGIYNHVTSEKYYFLPQSTGKHGSKALWNNNSSHEEYWRAVKTFLMKLKKN